MGTLPLGMHPADKVTSVPRDTGMSEMTKDLETPTGPATRAQASGLEALQSHDKAGGTRKRQRKSQSKYL